jgi:hypothetical protein
MLAYGSGLRFPKPEAMAQAMASKLLKSHDFGINIGQNLAKILVKQVKWFI